MEQIINKRLKKGKKIYVNKFYDLQNINHRHSKFHVNVTIVSNLKQ